MPRQLSVAVGVFVMFAWSSALADKQMRACSLLTSAEVGDAVGTHVGQFQESAIVIPEGPSQGETMGGCTGSFSFRDPRLSVFSLPLRRGRARVGVKAGGVPRPCCSPPSPPSPARGEGVEGPGRRGEKRELNGPGGCMWPIDDGQSLVSVSVMRTPQGAQRGAGLTQLNQILAGLKGQGWTEEQKMIGNAMCATLTPPPSAAHAPLAVGCLAEAKQMGISVGWMTGKAKKVAPEKIKALLDKVIGRLP